MPRAVLAYRLPQEADEFQVALDGWKWREAVREIEATLRSWERHEVVPAGVDQANPAYGLREMVWGILEERGLAS